MQIKTGSILLCEASPALRAFALDVGKKYAGFHEDKFLIFFCPFIISWIVRICYV
jgi:hypothetical protein